MNRRLPVPWWKRPQYWSYSVVNRGGELRLVCPARAMWRIHELTFGLQGRFLLGEIQPERPPKD